MPASLAKKCFNVAAIAIAAAAVCACAIIAGNEESAQPVSPLLNIHFIETLRNERSLSGESLRELPEGKNPSSAVFLRPGSVFADQFRVYVTDTVAPGHAGVLIFDRGNRTVFPLNITLPPSSSEGRLLAPAGIAVDASGIIFVSDSQQGRVFGYDRNGALVRVLGRAQPLTSAQGLGILVSPHGLAVDTVRNRIYVADTQGQQVKVFNDMGFHLFDIGNSGKQGEDFRFPEAVSIDKNGTLYIVDSLRLRIFIFDPDGHFMRSFSLKGGVNGRSIKPSGIAVDSSGHIYVPDAVNNTILVFNNDGSLLTTWGRTGRLIGDFRTPTGIFIDDHDYIYIADQTNSRIQTFQYAK